MSSATILDAFHSVLEINFQAMTFLKTKQWIQSKSLFNFTSKILPEFKTTLLVHADVMQL